VVTVEVVDAWESNLEDLFAWFAGRFARVETRRRAFAYVRGLLAPLERKNGVDPCRTCWEPFTQWFAGDAAKPVLGSG
jgi:hypothetical protein